MVDQVYAGPFDNGVAEHVELTLDPGDALGFVEQVGSKLQVHRCIEESK